jgi:putative PIN family toxin of toxin-antitoxin system
VTIERRYDAISVFEKKSLLIDVIIEIDECRDKKDNKFLELAASFNADCIISGKLDLLVMHPFRGTDILSPSDFIKKFR